MKLVASWLLLTTLVFNVGCAGFSEYRAEQSAYREQKSLDEKNDWVDNNWRSGYGFNNPNPERVRDGLQPVNFDGSLDSDDDGGFFDNLIGDFVGNLFGDVIVYGVKSGFAAIGNSLRR